MLPVVALIVLVPAGLVVALWLAVAAIRQLRGDYGDVEETERPFFVPGNGRREA